MINLTKKIHISELRQGDTVLIDGDMHTVSAHHVNVDPLFGSQYKGYNHRETNGYLDVALFPKWYKGEIVSYVSQP